VTGDLVRGWGVHAMQGREFDRDREIDRALGGRAVRAQR
jgi:hypothetical protein